MGSSPKWNTVTAVKFIEEVERAVRPDWHVGLTGSVLYGHPDDSVRPGEDSRPSKDLDLIIYPHDASANPDVDKLYKKLRSLGLLMFASWSVVRERWRKQGSKDTKKVTVWTDREGRRVDIFLLR
jgi:hypothetical protein